MLNLVLIDVDSLSFMVIALNYCSWTWGRALWCWIGWFGIELKCGWGDEGMLLHFIYFDVIYTSIMLWLVRSTFGGGVMCFSCNWRDLVGVTLCNIMSMALLTTTWNYVSICVVMLSMTLSMYMWSHMCVFLLMLPKLIVLDYDFDIMSVLLRLSLGYSYLALWVYVE